MTNKFIVSLLLLTSCFRVNQDIEPTLHASAQERHLQSLDSPFPLPPKDSDWGKEYRIALAFARDGDYYRAITAFRRAEALSDGHYKLEIEYNILQCYYLGQRYFDAEQTFEKSSLKAVGPSFPAYHDLLVILYDTYLKLGQDEKAYHVLSLLEGEKTHETLAVSTIVQTADLPRIQEWASADRPYLSELYSEYCACKKSPTAAATLNALLPGTGYMYLGQMQTGITSMLLNGLFIWATVHFFTKGPVAAGIVTASLEAGWYVGGIHGGALQAKYYNERLYERLATPTMNQRGLFPVFQLRYSF